MKKILKISSVVLLASTFLVACSSNNITKNTETKSSTKKVEQKSNIKVGEYAPNFKLQNLKGDTVDLSSFVGKKVYLKFWASWCGPCKESIPELLKLMDNKERDFEVITIVTPGFNGEKSKEDFVKWYTEQGYEKLPVLFDESGDILKTYNVKGMPNVLLIDSFGRIAKIKYGVLNNGDTLSVMKDIN